MELRGLGHTDIAVSPIGLGGWQFSRGAGVVGRYWPAISQPGVVEIVRASLDHGINWFDTAEAYGGGDSERSLAMALQAVDADPPDVVAATKWWPLFRGAESIAHTLGEREEYLRPYRVSLYQIHDPYAFSTLRRKMQVLCHLIFERRIAVPGVALAWVIRFHGRAVFAVAGARTPEQAKENALALQLDLTEDELHRLDEVSRMVGLK